MTTIVLGVGSWTDGFRAAPLSRQHADLVRKMDFFLDEAALAEERGDNAKAERWLDIALSTEAKMRTKRRRPAAA